MADYTYTLTDVDTTYTYVSIFIPTNCTITADQCKFFIQRWASYYNENYTEMAYTIAFKALVDIIRLQIVQVISTSYKGSISEKEGQVQYSGANYNPSGWQNYLDFLYENPGLIDPTLNYGNRMAFIKIGGTKLSEQRILDNDTDRLDGGYDIDNFYTEHTMGQNYFTDSFRKAINNYYYYFGY